MPQFSDIKMLVMGKHSQKLENFHSIYQKLLIWSKLEDASQSSASKEISRAFMEHCRAAKMICLSKWHASRCISTPWISCNTEILNTSLLWGEQQPFSAMPNGYCRSKSCCFQITKSFIIHSRFNKFNI